ncbi:hypothetical protein LTR37_017540 [Vermiconidia calcicola]|uniref:Uncharacterized protein n=1 Tax=Vermiconidia calcicola TaxID=1690605 RepID=A0ACC3MLA5_9PEZI|nr:hypothetical protein LTR37_017540 [Vermiconidia calcicola]
MDLLKHLIVPSASTYRVNGASSTLYNSTVPPSNSHNGNSEDDADADAPHFRRHSDQTSRVVHRSLSNSISAFTPEDGETTGTGHSQGAITPYVPAPAYSFPPDTNGTISSIHSSSRAERVSRDHYNTNHKRQRVDATGSRQARRSSVKQDALPASRAIGVIDGQPAVGDALAGVNRSQNPTVNNTQSSMKKRKVPFRHHDDPTPVAGKRRKVDYDEVSEATQDVKAEAETCFFWYHGRCSRSLDPRNNYHCDYRHDLTDQPTMVQPPPGYKHPAVCGLEWCPGDGAGEGKRHSGNFEPSQKSPNTHSVKIKAAVEGSNMRDVRDHSPSTPEPDDATTHNRTTKCSKQSPNSQDTNEGQTCFFWYHGKCRRIRCSMRHELTDPPSMVQPPPGYVHRKQCGLQWCPGDAKHSGSDHDLLGASKLSVLKAESNTESGCESLHGEGRAEHDNVTESWYLTGFDEAE